MDLLADFLEYIERPRPRSVEQLLGRVLSKCREITAADAGGIYLVTKRAGGPALAAVELQYGDSVRRSDDYWMPLNSSSVAGYVGLSGETAREADVYAIPPDRPYRFNEAWDRSNQYRSRSMLCFPLTNFDGEVIAVVQLVNHRTRRGIGPFPASAAARVRHFNRLIGGSVERSLMVERIRSQNRTLRERSRRLAAQRSRIVELQEQTEEAFRLSVGLLARAAELYDEETGNHIVRVNEYSAFLAEKAGMPKAFCDEIRYSAQLHDVGKMGVDAAVLRKAGPLTDADRAEMGRHPIYGHDILRQSDRLQMAAEIALNHHEKWDGSGYPRGIKGEEIPVSARIVQIADVYDALRAARQYKTAFDHAGAVRVILEGDDRIDPAGHFDPRLLSVFADHHKGFDRIWRDFAD